MTGTKMQLVDWLDDLCVRFIINLPQEELESVERICFQVEEAQWFYEDFIRPLDPSLPSLNLKKFCLLIFQHCPLLSAFSENHHTAAYSEFLAYKTRVPVRGAILLNEDMDHVVLVKGWKKGARWSFPRGKINKDEKDLDCAIREVYEETGFDIHAAGLVQKEEDQKWIEVSMREQHMRLYVFRGVPMDTYFEPRTRKEISKIDWYRLSDLPTLKRQRHQQLENGEEGLKDSMFYMVAPFLGPLKGWIKQQRKTDRVKAAKGTNVRSAPILETDGEGVETADEDPAAAGNWTADEGAAGKVQGERQADAHMDRLLAQLRSPPQVPEQNSLPEVSGVQQPGVSQPGPDAAAELMRMLSVGAPPIPAQPAPHIPVPAQAQAPVNPLLAMLQGGAGQAPAPANSVPRTPVEKIQNVPAQPVNSHHQHNRQPIQGPTPPPAVNIIPQQAHWQQRAAPVAQQQNLLSLFAQNGASRQDPPHNETANMSRAEPTQEPQQLPMYRPAIPQITHMAQPPYHRTGDPQFAPGPQFSEVHAPAIPPASRLPPPRLNAHTLSLLNAFKNDSKASPSATRPVDTAPHKNISAQAQMAANVYKSPEIIHPQSLGQQPQPIPSESLGPAPSNQKVLLPASVSGTDGKPRSSHQDALLNLFKKRPAQTSSSLTPNTAHEEASEPVELSAQPSPGLSRSTQLHRMPPAGPQEPPKPQPLTIPDVSQGAPELTSATITGPLNAPDFDTIKRQGRPSLQSYSSANGDSMMSPRENTGIPLFFTQAEAAPTDPRLPQAATPPVPVHIVSPKTNLEAPKPFHPQIMQRSQRMAATSTPTPPPHPQPQQRQRRQHQTHAQIGNLPQPQFQYSSDSLSGFQENRSPQQPPQQPRQPSASSQRSMPPPPLPASKQPLQQPQQQAARSQPQPVPAAVFDRRASLSNTQKSALLNLFGKQSHQPGAAAAHSAIKGTMASGFVSPVSPLTDAHGNTATTSSSAAAAANSAGNGGSGGQQHAPELATRSRISSVASVPASAGAASSSGGEPVGVGAGNASGGKKEGGGSGTPVTPVDRSFLLGYLEGVAKLGK